MRFFLVIFFVPLTICSPNIAITPELLESVFGNPEQGANEPQPQAVPQALPVSPPKNDMTGTEDDMDQYQPSEANFDKFDWTLTKRVAASSPENFLLSPLGLKLALAILMEGSTGTTRAELSSVLGLDSNKQAVRQKFGKILDSLHTKSSQYILNLASRIYIGGHVVPQQSFSAIAEHFYKTELKSLDFADPVNASNSINQWVSNNTEGRIAHLVDSADVTGVSALVLDIIFFKGTWRQQFPPNATNVDTFYLSSTEKKNVPFMNVKSKLFYAESSRFNAKILRMPYLGNKFAMYIIVPNSINGLPSLFNELSDIQSELNYLQESIVYISLPKFQFEYTSLLDGVLKELGIRQAFEDTASFPGLSRGNYLKNRMKISKVLQHSGIEVNEVGSVVYSATAIYLENKFGEDVMSNVEVIANKPFLFFIQDEQTRQLLFTGRVADPSSSVGAYKVT